MIKTDEPAYTPREEFNCDSSTSHYQGCKCHEARREKEIRHERDHEILAMLRSDGGVFVEFETAELFVEVPKRLIADWLSEELRKAEGK